MPPEKLDKRLLSYLKTACQNKASDLHIKASAPPKVRVNGNLVPLKVDHPLTAEETEGIIRSTMSEQEWNNFLQSWERDYSLDVPSLGRFRVNAFYTRGTVGMVARVVSAAPPSLKDLGIPDPVRLLSQERNGLIIVSGATGSGKTTTLAGIVDQINANRSVHIVTIEDPIEIIHEDKKASISQRELSSDTKDYSAALHSALRQDPDVILIGEMRHEDTVRTALQAAQTGHLVLSTLHTTSAAETINRLVEFFPEREQKQVRINLAESLRGVVCQRLVPVKDSDARVALVEILLNRGRVPETILDPSKGDLKEIMEASRSYGMQTFDDNLLSLLSRGVITMPTALENSPNRHDFKIKAKSINERTG